MTAHLSASASPVIAPSPLVASQISKQRTKIVATIGPACSSTEGLRALIMAGVDVCRLNFSHGAHEDHLPVIERVRALNAELGTSVSLMADLQGPKLRVGVMPEGGVELIPGNTFSFTTHEQIGTAGMAYMTYQAFPKDVEAGDRILLDDGKLELEVISTNREDQVVAKVIHGGILTSKKGVNLPNTKVSLPSLTEKDAVDLEFALAHDVDWVALSFVRTAEDIHDLRQRITAAGKEARIIAKIEKPAAVENLEEILQATDAVMVARGDLGVEIPLEKVPLVQKRIVRLALDYTRPVIIATQMMESMITSPGPTRAETTDVANAVLDGADALMLSAETSVGKYPTRVIEYMARIITSIEESSDSIYHRDRLLSPDSPTFVSDNVCFTAAKLTKDVDAAAVVTITKSGYTAFKISSFRNRAPIYVFTDHRPLMTQLSLVWGVECFYYDGFESTDQTISDIRDFLRDQGLVKPGQLIVNTGSMPMHARQRTNMLKVTVVEE
jgi:pyruvate kinase